MTMGSELGQGLSQMDEKYFDKGESRSEGGGTT